MNEVTKASSNKSVTPFSTKQENAIAAIGAFAGPPGAIAGAVLGAVAGVEYGIENGAASREEKIASSIKKLAWAAEIWALQT